MSSESQELDSEEIYIGSQTSNFSDTSDKEAQREITKMELDRKVNKLTKMLSSLRSINLPTQPKFDSVLGQNVS